MSGGFGANEGVIGEDSWFSVIFAHAAQGNLTGGVLVRSPAGDAAVFFRDGRPVHAAGTGFTSHHLGTILVQMGACQAAQVDAAVAKQSEHPDPPLLGTLLVADAGVNPADVKRAIQRQNEARFAHLFSWGEGSWTAAPGENARIREVGVVTQTWPIFFAGLAGAPDKELRGVSDRLLGKAVQLKGGTLGLVDYEPGKLEKKLIDYLEKPRKPDQLERALKNRRGVRGFLRALELLDRLKILPAAQGIAIPKASLVSMDLPGAEHFKAAANQAKASRPSSEPVHPPEPRAPARPSPPKKHPMVDEVEAAHAGLKDKNHFELLDANDKTTSSELRKKFTDLAKKFHPDALPSDIAPDVAAKAREISAAINEAYQTLSNEEKRAHYMVLLADHRIRGDLRKVEKVRDAEMKAKMGAVMLRKKDYKGARDLFRFAMEMDPETALYKAHYAWSVFADPKNDRTKALDEAYPLVKEALAQNKDDAAIHYYMGQLSKAMAKDKEALSHFKQVLRLDRNHADAKREVRLIEMRESKRKDTGSKGPKSNPLSRLFKKS